MNNTKKKGKEAKKEEGENMRSLKKKCKSKREEDTI
jgi:hypothetical protein